MRLLLGVIPLLIVAGVIEGFVSPVAMEPGRQVRDRRRDVDRCSPSICSASTRSLAHGGLTSSLRQAGGRSEQFPFA